MLIGSPVLSLFCSYIGAETMYGQRWPATSSSAWPKPEPLQNRDTRAWFRGSRCAQQQTLEKAEVVANASVQDYAKSRRALMTSRNCWTGPLQDFQQKFRFGITFPSYQCYPCKYCLPTQSAAYVGIWGDHPQGMGTTADLPMG